MKEEIIQMEKVQLEQLLQRMNGENARETLKSMEQHMEVIRYVCSCQYTEIATAAGAEPESQSGAEPEAEPVLPESRRGMEQEELIAPMCRGLRGGFLGEQKDIFVPENVIRTMRFSHGDIIKAERLNTKYYQKHYKFTRLQQRSDGYDEPEPACIYGQSVRSDDQKKHMYIQAEEKEKGQEIRVYLSEMDVEKYEIEAGDQIDYAYYEGDIFHGMIRWKHSREHGNRS